MRKSAIDNKKFGEVFCDIVFFHHGLCNIFSLEKFKTFIKVQQTNIDFEFLGKSLFFVLRNWVFVVRRIKGRPNHHIQLNEKLGWLSWLNRWRFTVRILCIVFATGIYWLPRVKNNSGDIDCERNHFNWCTEVGVLCCCAPARANFFDSFLTKRCFFFLLCRKIICLVGRNSESQIKFFIVFVFVCSIVLIWSQTERKQYCSKTVAKYKMKFKLVLHLSVGLN